MNTHDIELPPLPVPRTKTDGGIELFAEYSVRDYARAAIEPYQRRIEELEAIGAGGVSAGQRLMTREAVGLQAPSVALLLKIKTYTAACAERLGQPEIDRRWADICSAARDYAAEQVELDRQRRGEPVAFAKDGNLFWRGDPVAWREFSGELYLAPQPVDPVELDRYDAGLLGGQDGMPAYVWHDIIRAELDRAYDFYMDQLDRATPQPAESHVDRANRIVDSWPEWKRNYALTKHDVKPTQLAEPVKVSSDDERAAQGLPPYSPRHLTEEEWTRLTEDGRRAWGNHPAVPEKEPPCDT